MRGTWASLLSICLLTSSCAKTAAITVWKPATLDISQLNRLAIADFAGEQGQYLSTALAYELRENAFYEVLPRQHVKSEILQASHVQEAAGGLAPVLESARRQGLDAILVGEVIEHHCSDDRRRDTEFSPAHPHAEWGRARRNGQAFAFETRETLTRSGAVTLVVRLIDVQAEETRFEKRISHHYREQTVNGVGRLPEHDEVLDQLMQRCIEDVVALLAPHQGREMIQLAQADIWTRGRADVQRGVRLAQADDWDGAEELWKRALERDPNNAAALFNLGVLAAHRREFAEAEECIMHALRLDHSDCFAKGLEKIRTHRSAYERAEQQRDARIFDAASRAMTGL